MDESALFPSLMQALDTVPCYNTAAENTNWIYECKWDLDCGITTSTYYSPTVPVNLSHPLPPPVVIQQYQLPPSPSPPPLRISPLGPAPLTFLSFNNNNIDNKNAASSCYYYYYPVDTMPATTITPTTVQTLTQSSSRDSSSSSESVVDGGGGVIARKPWVDESNKATMMMNTRPHQKKGTRAMAYNRLVEMEDNTPAYQNAFKCQVKGCGCYYRYKNDLLQHAKKHTSGQYNNNNPNNKKKQQQQQRLSHARLTPAEKEFQCVMPGCKSGFTYKRDLWRHLRTLHVDEYVRRKASSVIGVVAAAAAAKK